MALNILHLSDLHIGKSSLDLEFLACAISMGLAKRPEEKIGQIVVTGDTFDATFHTDTTDIQNDFFDNAKDFFKELIKQINDKQRVAVDLSLDDVLFVPGNNELERAQYYDNIAFCNQTGKLFKKFKEFLNFFYDDNIPIEYNMEHLSLFKKFEEEKVIIIGFNSASCNNKGDTFGEIGIRQLYSIVNKLNHFAYDDYSIVVLLHHHFYQFDERSKSYIDNSSLRDQETFLTSLNDFNVTAILHGHKHESLLKRININTDLQKADKMITAIACGSTNHNKVSVNNFNVVTIYAPEDQLTLKLLEYERHRKNIFDLKFEISIPIFKNALKIGSLTLFLKQSPEYYNVYEQLYKYGRNCDKFIEFLNKTVGQCSVCCEILQKNKKAILYMFLMAYHRANCEDKDIDERMSQILLNIPNKDIKCNDVFVKIMESNNIYDLTAVYRENTLLNIDTYSQSEKEVIIFSLISFFISYLYYTLNQNAGGFFNFSLKKKTNLDVLDENEVNQGIDNNIIEIIANEDTRSIDIDVKCTTTLSHKVVTLIIKEFELLLTTFEIDFASVGFKMYHLTGFITSPRITENKLESYAFTAYMPTLLKIFAGNHVYSDKKVFMRELIQNSIDAIGLRKTKDMNFANAVGEIEITIREKNSKIKLNIKDNGVGMTEYHIERYLTTLGRSFYKSEDFLGTESSKQYTPISQFGIGFLSCFNVSNSVQVKTKYYDSAIEPHCNTLEIPNIDGLFFIEKNETDMEIGTSIELVIDTEKINSSKYITSLLTYIVDLFCNIQCDISYNGSPLVKRNAFIQELKKDTVKYGLLFKILLTDEGTIKKDADIDNNDYGIFIYKRDNDLYKEPTVTCMCNGIKIDNWDMDQFPSFFLELQNNYFDIAVNFSSWNIELEVSKDKIKKFNIKENKEFKCELDKKIKTYINEKKDIYKNISYHVLHKISPNYFPLSDLSIFCDNKNLCIGLNKKNKHSTACSLLEFFFGNTKLQINGTQNFNNLATNMFFCLTTENISTTVRSIRQNMDMTIMDMTIMDMTIMDRAIVFMDRATMVMDRVIMDMDRATMDMDRNVSMIIDMAVKPTDNRVIDRVIHSPIYNDILNNTACYLLRQSFKVLSDDKKSDREKFFRFCVAIQLIPVIFTGIMTLEHCEKNQIIDCKL